MSCLKIKPANNYLLVPDLVWDGFSNKPAKNLAVLIRDGVIDQLLAHPAPDNDGAPDTTMTPSEDIETVRLPGITLMPGLVDCHIHLAMDSQDLFRAVDDWEHRPQLVEQRTRRAAADYLANGVLAVRDGGDRMNIGINARNNINLGIFPGPLVIATGRAIYRKGMYGNFLGPGTEDVIQAAAQLEMLVEEGIDQLKVVVSGIVSFKEFGSVGPVQFTVSELKKIIDKAHGLGIKVMAHASSPEAVETAVLAGADSIEHGYFLETKQLRLMAGAGTAWIPTLAPLGNLVETGLCPYEGADMSVIRKSFELQLQRIKEANELGVRIGVGTDAGANNVPHGYSYHQELAYYARTGLDNLTVLGMATSVSAGILGLEHRIGSVSPGKLPMFIGIRGNPLASLSLLKKPEWIISI